MTWISKSCGLLWAKTVFNQYLCIETAAGGLGCWVPSHREGRERMHSSFPSYRLTAQAGTHIPLNNEVHFTQVHFTQAPHVILRFSSSILLCLGCWDPSLYLPVTSGERRSYNSCFCSCQRTCPIPFCCFCICSELENRCTNQKTWGKKWPFSEAENLSTGFAIEVVASPKLP